VLFTYTPCVFDLDNTAWRVFNITPLVIYQNTATQVHFIFVDEKFYEDLLRQHVFSPDIVSVIYSRGKKKQPVFKKNFFNRVSEIERDHN